MKKVLVLSVIFALWNCNNSLAMLPYLLNMLQEKLEDKDSKKEKKEKKPVISDSEHTLSNDISFLPSVSLGNKESKFISLNHKVGDKYVSSRIILKNLSVKASLNINTSKNIGIEIYRGSSPLKTKSDKENKFETAGKNNFKFLRNNKVYSIKTSKKGAYTLLLVYSSAMEVEIRRTDIKNEVSFLREIPTNSIEITEKVQTIPTIFQNKYEQKGSVVTTIQLTYNLKKGDRIMTQGSSIYDNTVMIFSSTYKGDFLFRDRADMKKREIKCVNDFSCKVLTNYWNSSPGRIAFKTGSYSDILFLLSRSPLVKVNELNTVKMVKVTPKIPRVDAPIIAIHDTFQAIEYTMDKRNELYSGWTSNQFILTQAKKGTKIIILLPKPKITSLYDLPELSLYSGTEKLTKENINNRYLYEDEVLSDKPHFFDGEYYIDKPGDYSIIFNNYNETRLSHKVKIEES